MSAPSGPTRQLAEFAANVRFDDLPGEAVEALSALVFDTVATALAASTLGDACPELIRLASQSGPPECTILGAGVKTSLLLAALTNGGLAHALNYDAVGLAHFGLLPAAPLALAEQRGGVSGREFLAALAAGAELVARLGRAAASAQRGRRLVLEGQLLAYFGVAVACGRLMRLDADRMHSALGLALMQAAGSRQVVFEGDPPAKSIYGAFPNQGGLLAALLAEQGIGAQCEAFEGEAGLFRLFYGGDCPGSLLSEALGAGYQLRHVQFKRWPTSGNVAPFIAAALELREELGSPVESFQVTAGPWAREWLEPPGERRRPATISSAANSIFYGVAKALLHGTLALSDFTPAGLCEEAALALAARATHSIDDRRVDAGTLEVRAPGGRSATREISRYGEQGLDKEWLLRKFRDCAGFAAQPITSERVDRLIELMGGLQDVADMRSITQNLAVG